MMKSLMKTAVSEFYQSKEELRDGDKEELGVLIFIII